jgi:cyclopropane-fatty-acyl-phospholipid synthase
MPSSKIRDRVEQLLVAADVSIGGARPWDIQLHDDRFYTRVVAHGSLGIGESYMDGWWDCESLDELFYRALKADLDRKIRPLWDALSVLQAKLFNLQRPSRAFRLGRHHYDLGNDLFRLMLDSRMIYSCGYWQDASTLDEAQEAKLDLVCCKLALTPGMRVLDIGCGWGGTAKFAAERYGVSVVGITVSAEQARYARELCNGLDVEIRLEDYRDLTGTFDRVLSIGMFEHVGPKNYDTFMAVVRACLPDDGLFLLHTIGATRTLSRTDPWTHKYIFPDSRLPSASQISRAFDDRFVLEDWHSFGSDYDTTLMHWHQNFERHWPELKERYDERFYRMWRYFLLTSAGTFRARKNQLWQVVLSPRGVEGGYEGRR